MTCLEAFDKWILLASPVEQSLLAMAALVPKTLNLALLVPTIPFLKKKKTVRDLK